MTLQIVGALVTLAYWTSFGLIGWAFVRLANSVRRAQTLTKFIIAAPVYARLLLYVVVGFGVIAPFIVLGFAARAPIAYLDVVYLLLAATSAIVAFIAVRNLLAAGWYRAWRRPKMTLVLAGMLILGLVLCVDGGIAYHIGAYIANGNDAYVHMAKIEQLTHGHLSLDDPYFRGVIESRYHVNIIHSLYAVGGSLTGIETINFWMYSNPFFRLLAWLSVFVLAWHFSPFGNKRLFAVFATILAVPMFVWAFVAADYPNVAVLTWLAVWLVALSRFIARRDGWLLLLSSLVIGMTHPVYSLGAAGFLLLAGAYLLCFDRAWANRRRIAAWLIAVSVLIMPSLVTVIYPNRLSETTQGFGGIATTHTLGGTIIKPIIPDLSGWPLLLLPLSLLGYFFIIRSRTNRHERVILGILVVYFALLAYNPFVNILAGDLMPPWLLQRFTFINRLQVIAVVAGLVGLLGWLARYVQVRRDWQRIAIICLAALPLLVSSWQGVDMYRKTKMENDSQLALMRSIEKLQPKIEHQIVFMPSGDSFIMPSVAPLHVIAMPDTNASPVANMTIRMGCNDYLLKTLDRSALLTAGVTRVMIGAWHPGLMRLAKQKPYLEIIGGNNIYTIFAVKQISGYTPVKACEIPYGQ